MQIEVVGKAQTSYLPGVLVPEVNAGGAAEAAGFQPGDVILRIGDHEVAANPGQVSAVALHSLPKCACMGVPQALAAGHA